MPDDGDPTRRPDAVAPTPGVLVAMLRHEVRSVFGRIVGRDRGTPLLARVPLTATGKDVRDETAPILLAAASWPEAVETVRSRWNPRVRRRAAAMLSAEHFDDFVVFAVRAVTEVLRQSVEGPIIDRPDLRNGLEHEARLNRLCDAAVYAEAARLVPDLDDVAPAGSTRPEVQSAVEALLRAHAHANGPIPAVLLDATVRHLSRALS